MTTDEEGNEKTTCICKVTTDSGAVIEKELTNKEINRVSIIINSADYKKSISDTEAE